MVIRRLPEDFVVTERLAADARAPIVELPGPRARYAVYLVRKVSLTTPEAATRIAREMGVKASAVSWCGLKDKHAVCVQHMTVEYPGNPLRLSRGIELVGLTATLMGWATSAADASWIASNHFQIVVRALDSSSVEHIIRKVETLRDPLNPTTLRFVNYFGEQRFASARHGEGFAARALIAGDFETALRLLIATPARKDSGERRASTRLLAEKWGRWEEIISELPRSPERRVIETLVQGDDFRAAFETLPNFTKMMAVEAFQSFLWNQIAGRTAGALSEDEAGSSRPRQSTAVPPDLIGLHLPMAGPGADFPARCREATAAVLEHEGISLDKLRIPGLRRPAFGTPLRPLIAEAGSFRISAPERDVLAKQASAKPLSLRLEFALPRGAYATVLLRALES